jgi:streptogramin lyase
MRAAATRSSLSLLAILAVIGACLAVGASAATVTTFPVEVGAAPGAHKPMYIARSPLGELWFTDDGKSEAVRAINTAGAPLTAITEFFPAGDLAFAPDGTLFWASGEKGVAGVASRSPGGKIAFTNSGFFIHSYAVGFTKAGAFEFTAEEENAPRGWRTCNSIGCTSVAPTRLTDLTLDSQGALWAMQPEGDTARRLLGGGFTALAVNLPAGSRPGRAALGPDGNLWIAGFGNSLGADNTTNQIIRLTPSGQQTSFPLPPGRGPNDIALGPDGALWFTEFISNSIGRITTAGEYSSCPLPNAAANPGPYGIVAGPDNALWFTEYAAGAIGRISGPPCVPAGPLSPPQATPISVNPPAKPKVTALTLAPSAFRAMKAGGPLVAKRAGGAGSQLTFTASAATALSFAIERKLPGRRQGSRCLAATRANRAKPACTRLLPFGQPFPVAATAGTNALVFSGRLGNRAFSAGGYRLNARVDGETQSSFDFRILPAQR